jgi:hypothetical protein
LVCRQLVNFRLPLTVLTGVSFVGGLATGLSLADAPFPQPGADVKDIHKFFQGSSGADAST